MSFLGQIAVVGKFPGILAGLKILKKRDNPVLQIEQDQLIGKSTSHLAQAGEFAGVLHAQIVQAYRDLEDRARSAGFDLRIASGFRSFDRQLVIWNAKVRGRKDVYDDKDRKVDMSALTEVEQVEAIMRFSALPGSSRHHWGTDFDVYDASHIKRGYRLQLNLGECRDNGPCAELHAWLDAELPHTGFYRPYAIDTGGVSPEPWHLSFRSLASEYAGRMSIQILQQSWDGADLALAHAINENIPRLYNRFVVVD